MPSRLIKLEEINVAATPMNADNPLNPPMTEGLRPVKQCEVKLRLPKKPKKAVKDGLQYNDLWWFKSKKELH